MATLVIFRGPRPGRQFFLQPVSTVIGREMSSHISLESHAVSRQHARVLCEDGQFSIEDMGSSNGTFLNGKRVRQRMDLTPRDILQIGPYYLSLRLPEPPPKAIEDVIIRDRVPADPANASLLGQDARHKLQRVLEISQQLARTLETSSLLGKFLDQLLALFPQADRAIVLMGEDDNLVIRSSRYRNAEHSGDLSYSRTVVQQALREGIGITSEDVQADQRFKASTTVAGIGIRSLLCVPLICQDGRRLGALQLDSFDAGKPFHLEDLQLATALGMQAAVALDNAALHAEVLREDRILQELKLAREIQQGFLPTDFPTSSKDGFELFARCYPAHEISGDLYDYFRLPNKNVVFFVGDIAGKGIPAALFMVAVRTLFRHMVKSSASPAATLDQLNTALAADNQSGIFVTLLHGIYSPLSGEMVLASAGHPLPYLRRAGGTVEEVRLLNGRSLGYQIGNMQLADCRLSINPGDTLMVFTDGLTESRAPDGQALFGLDSIKLMLAQLNPSEPLSTFVDQARAAVQQFTQVSALHDDLSFLLLRRAN